MLHFGFWALLVKVFSSDFRSSWLSAMEGGRYSCQYYRFHLHKDIVKKELIFLMKRLAFYWYQPDFITLWCQGAITQVSTNGLRNLLKIEIDTFILLIYFQQVISFRHLLKVLKSGILSQRLLRTVHDTLLPSPWLSGAPKHTLILCSSSNQLPYVI